MVIRHGIECPVLKKVDTNREELTDGIKALQRSIQAERGEIHWLCKPVPFAATERVHLYSYFLLQEFLATCWAPYATHSMQ